MLNLFARGTGLVMLVVVLVAANFGVGQVGGRVEFEGDDDYAALWLRAEGLVAEKSFAQAREVYVAMAGMLAEDGEASEKRWVDFRLADLKWRAQAGSGTRDNTVYQEAREELAELVQVVKRVVDRDRVWAEAEESLGGLTTAEHGNNYWRRDRSWVYYEKALDWWAGASDVELARERYLELVWKATEPRGGWRSAGVSGDVGSADFVSAEVLRNVRAIAVERDDWARGTYFLIRKMERQGMNARRAEGVEQLYLELLDLGSGSVWFDDALFHYAEWLARYGLAVQDEATGRWRREADFVKAVEVFERFLDEFGKGESAYWERAGQRIANITDGVLDVAVGNAFLPGSAVQFQVAYRNVEKVEFELLRVNLAAAVDFSAEVADGYEYLDRVDERELERVRKWEVAGKEFGTHRPQSEMVQLAVGEDGKQLATGGYVLRARAMTAKGGVTARDLILVSDVTLVAKTGSNGEKLLTYLCDAEDGSPIAGADLKMWMMRRIDRNRGSDLWWGKAETSVTDGDGKTLRRALW